MRPFSSENNTFASRRAFPCPHCGERLLACCWPLTRHPAPRVSALSKCCPFHAPFTMTARFQLLRCCVEVHGAASERVRWRRGGDTRGMSSGQCNNVGRPAGVMDRRPGVSASSRGAARAARLWCVARALFYPARGPASGRAHTAKVHMTGIAGRRRASVGPVLCHHHHCPPVAAFAARLAASPSFCVYRLRTDWSACAVIKSSKSSSGL